MMDVAAVLAFLLALTLAAIGLQAHVSAWLLCAVVVLLALGAVERATEKGLTPARAAAVMAYAVGIAVLLFALRARANKADRP
jgi:hypothetical protein